MVFGKRWLFLIGNGAEFQPLEMGRKSPDFFKVLLLFVGKEAEGTTKVTKED